MSKAIFYVSRKARKHLQPNPVSGHPAIKHMSVGTKDLNFNM